MRVRSCRDWEVPSTLLIYNNIISTTTITASTNLLHQDLIREGCRPCGRHYNTGVWEGYHFIILEAVLFRWFGACSMYLFANIYNRGENRLSHHHHIQRTLVSASLNLFFPSFVNDGVISLCRQKATRVPIQNEPPQFSHNWIARRWRQDGNA